MAAIETHQASSASMAKVVSGNDVAFAKCECCGLTEECTEAYIKRVRDRFQGRWICGLCAEAVQDEAMRSETKSSTSSSKDRRLIGKEEALNRHMSFCKKFSSLRRPPQNPTEELISAVKQLLLRSLDSPPRSSPMRGKPSSSSMLRSKSCFPVLEG